MECENCGIKEEWTEEEFKEKCRNFMRPLTDKFVIAPVQCINCWHLCDCIIVKEND